MTNEYTREQLLSVLESYSKMIKRNGKDYPTVTLDDIEKSLEYVLEKNGR